MIKSILRKYLNGNISLQRAYDQMCDAVLKAGTSGKISTKQYQDYMTKIEKFKEDPKHAKLALYEIDL